jgi:hypothetical protein
MIATKFYLRLSAFIGGSSFLSLALVASLAVSLLNFAVLLFARVSGLLFLPATSIMKRSV